MKALQEYAITITVFCRVKDDLEAEAFNCDLQDLLIRLKNVIALRPEGLKHTADYDVNNNRL